MATTDIRVNLGITADNAQALAAINGVKSAFNGLAVAATKADQAGTLPNTQRQLSALRATMAGFRNALVAYAGLRVIGSVLSDLAGRIDTFTTLNARVKLAAGSTQEAVKAFAALRAMSASTAVPLGDLATLYGRIGQAVRVYTGDSGAALQVTESLALGLRASGATAEETASAILQFSQAVNSGRLAGEEFRAVYEAAPRYVDALAQSLGVSAGRLYEMSKAQELTLGKIVEATPRITEVLREQAAGMPQTIGVSMKSLSDAFDQYIGKAAEANGVTAAINESLQWLAKNIDIVVAAFAGLFTGAALGLLGLVAAAMWNLARNASFAAVATTALTKPWAALTTAAAVGAGLFGVAAAFDALGDEAEDATKKTDDASAALKTLRSDLLRAQMAADTAREALRKFRDEQSKTTFKSQAKELEEAVGRQAKLVEELNRLAKEQADKAKEYAKKGSDARRTYSEKAVDAEREGMTASAAALDTSIEAGSKYLTTQRKLADLREAVSKGEVEDALRIGEEIDNLIGRREALADTMKASDKASAFRQLSKDAGSLNDLMAEISRLAGAGLFKRGEEERRKLEDLKLMLEGIKAQIEEIENKELRVKENTLLKQVQDADEALARLQGKLEQVASPEEMLPLTKRADVQKLIKEGATPEMAVNMVPAMNENEFNAQVATLMRSAKFDIERGLNVEEVIKQLNLRLIDAGVQIPMTADPKAARDSINAALAELQKAVQPIVVPVVAQPVTQLQPISDLEGYAVGGRIRSPNAVDNLLGWFNKDEFVMRAQAVRKYGTNFMNSINSLSFPAFAAGGAVGSYGTPVNVYLPSGESFPLRAEANVAKEMVKVLGKEVLKRGRR